ncbi:MULTISPECIES: hypothetical protein [unclassified Bradyrhizobium]|uniref:hypothetical protein n=1 Tax=unclassified Bradyrhizobium TaxID=2631580 RepID=UPI001FF6FCDF|nr:MULTISPECIES: hypothetical protein [unclassified Bradyrhizobium]MCK1538684.1 hypothetical protein [Bradyrhizobium sp. 176]MCK1558626.1 hypothetical protein [Bradyrhizobium sp. 171]MCK1689587.1 hypothetical protein [Bradyrhizobium sp. 145]
MTSIYLDIVCATFPKVDAAIAIRKSDKIWSENKEENHQTAKKIFASKTGDWTFISDGSITKLMKDGNEVGALNDFNPDYGTSRRFRIRLLDRERRRLPRDRHRSRQLLQTHQKRGSLRSSATCKMKHQRQNVPIKERLDSLR